VRQRSQRVAAFLFAFVYYSFQLFNSIKVVRIFGHVLFDLLVFGGRGHIVGKRPTHLVLSKQPLLVHLIDSIKTTEIIVESGIAKFATVFFQNLSFAVDSIDLDSINYGGIGVSEKQDAQLNMILRRCDVSHFNELIKDSAR